MPDTQVDPVAQGDTVIFIDGKGAGKCTALVLFVHKDSIGDKINIKYFDPQTGVEQFKSHVPYSVSVKADTYMFQSDDVEPTTVEQATAEALASHTNVGFENSQPVNFEGAAK